MYLSSLFFLALDSFSSLAFCVYKFSSKALFLASRSSSLIGASISALESELETSVEALGSVFSSGSIVVPSSWV